MTTATAPDVSVATQAKERALAALDQTTAELLKATEKRARVAFSVPKLATLRKQLIDDELCEPDVVLLTRFFDAWFTGRTWTRLV